VKAATLFGKPLPDGGTIGVCAPASPFENRSEILRGVEWWEQQGYRVKLADGVWDRQAYVAGDAKSRARDLVAMFADPEVDVVQCLQGGVGSAQTIPYLDFEVIAANPKALCGYSDITALHIAVRQRTGLATIQSNGLRGMGWNETPQFNKDRLLEVLRTGGVGEVPRDPDDPYVRAIRGGTATAPLVGGNLWLIAHGMGTPYEIDAEGCILFFEAVEQPPWVIDVQLTQLSHAGKLANVAGVVVGECHRCDWREERPEWPRTKSLEDVLEEHLEPLGVPVLYKLPLGHGKYHAAIPLGVSYTLDADSNTLRAEEPALRG